MSLESRCTTGGLRKDSLLRDRYDPSYDRKGWRR